MLLLVEKLYHFISHHSLGYNYVFQTLQGFVISLQGILQGILQGFVIILQGFIIGLQGFVILTTA